MSIWRVSTIDIVAIAVAITFGFLWIENHHRITLEPRLETESGFAAGTEACPTNDNIPYSARCLAFLDDGTSPPWRVTSIENNAALASVLTPNGGAGTAGSPCP